LKTGDAKLTVKLKNAHTKYQTDFGDDSPKNPKGEPFDWPSWLEYNGYGLDRSGHVYEMDETDVAMKRREYQ
jgi:hypothetical protein